MSRIKRFFAVVLAFTAGALPALFIIMAVFNDLFTFAERFVSFAAVFTIYGLLGLAFGFIMPRFSWRWGIWVSIPVFIITDWYLIQEPARIALHALYVVTASTAACLGAGGGAVLAQKRERR